MTTWPSDRKASTASTDSPTDYIKDARVDINQTIANVNDIIDNFDIANPSNGDLLQYNSTTGRWETISAGAISSQSLYIPMGGFVVNRWSQDGGSTETIKKFYQICTLGGPVIRRHVDTSIQSAVPYYGNIKNSTVNRPNPTINRPSGQITSTNTNIILTDGIRSFGTGDAGAGSGSSGYDSARLYQNHVYGTNYDNYIELPAGDYRISFLNNQTDANINYSALFDENSPKSTLQTITTMLVYNETDSEDIGIIDEITRLTEEFLFFSLENTAKIKFYSSNTNYGSGEPSIVDDGLGVSIIGPAIIGWNPSSNKLFFGSNAATSIPSKLGTYTEAPNRWIRIDKL